MAIDVIISVQNAMPGLSYSFSGKAETATSVVYFPVNDCRILMTTAAKLSRYLKRFFKIKIPNHEWLLIGKYKHEEVMTDGMWEKMRIEEGHHKEDG
jgi:hypothetical protein